MKAFWWNTALIATIGAVQAGRLATAAPDVLSVAQRELLQLNREAGEMQTRKDVAAAERLLAEDYVFLQADGNVSNKSQNVDVLRDPAFVCTAFTTEGVVVRVFGDVGVITGRAVMRATYGGHDVGGEFLYTDVWAKRNGRWQTVVSQATRRPAGQ